VVLITRVPVIAERPAHDTLSLEMLATDHVSLRSTFCLSPFSGNENRPSADPAVLQTSPIYIFYLLQVYLALLLG